MHVILIYKLATKPLEIEKQFKKVQKFPKPRQTIQKLKKFHKKYVQNGTSPKT